MARKPKVVPDIKVPVLANKITLLPTDTVHAYAGNAKKHPEAQLRALMKSLQRFGFLVPVLTDEAGLIIAGHGRVEAAKRLGMPEVPVIVAGHLTEDERRAFTIADNRLSELGEWDEELLGLELGDLNRADFDLELIGFSAADLSRLLRGEDDEPGDPDDVPDPEPLPVTVAGDVWLLGAHRIICGSSTDAATVAALLAGEKPHLMVTDPPYGVSYDANWRTEAGVNKFGQKIATGKVENDDRVDWQEAWDLFPGGVAYVWHGGLHTAAVADSLTRSGFAMRAQIIWAKNSLVIGRGHYHWQHEPCWYAVRKGATGQWNGDRKQATLWEIANMHRTQGNVDDGKTIHSTQKPVECMRRPIVNNSKAGDAIYEPFSGSGTTIIAAEMTERRCFAVELNPIYVDVAVRRWEAYTGKTALLADGRSFAQVAAERLVQAA